MTKKEEAVWLGGVLGHQTRDAPKRKMEQKIEQKNRKFLIEFIGGDYEDWRWLREAEEDHPETARGFMASYLELFLREVGTPDEIRKRRDALMYVNKTLHLNHLEELTEANTQDAITALGHHLDEIEEFARWAEEKLESMGWRFVPKDGQLQPSESKAPRPRRRLTDIVLNMYDELQPIYAEATGDYQLNPQELREQISRSLILDWHFSADQVSPDRQKPIWVIISNYRTNKKSLT